MVRITLLMSWFLTFSSAAFTFASLQSPFSSSLRNLSIRNSHIVTTHGSNTFVVRGQAPNWNQIDELVDFGIERVLIFKTDTKGEVAKEIAELKKRGYRSQDILHMEMPWKDIESFQEVCEMTIESLKFIEESIRQKRSVFFHCTVGEDRTGYLAALWGLWVGEYQSVNEAFHDEMCARGYERGNPKKPWHVAQKVRESVTPQFLKMVELLKRARLHGTSLSKVKCPTDLQVRAAIPKC